MHSYGFVNELAEDGTFQETLELVVDEYIDLPPIALEIAKGLVIGGFEAPLEVGLDMELYGSRLAHTTEDAREGIEAFREKRSPEFRGR
jgi:enoyl-CoA hydratase/carnithine racemase